MKYSIKTRGFLFVCFIICVQTLSAQEEISISKMKSLGMSAEAISTVQSLAKNENDKVILISSSFRGLWPEDFSTDFRVVETKDNVEENVSTVKNYVHLQEAGKTWTSISIVTNQENNANTRILQDGTSLWFHRSGTRRAIRISPAQRLLGGASYADVASTNYFYDYNVDVREDVVIGNTDAYQFTLLPKHSGTAYASVRYWVRKTDFRPVKAEFYAQSGRKLKSMYFRAYKKVQGRTVSTEWVIVDGLKESLVTYLILENLQEEQIPERYFNYTAFPDMP